MAAPVIQFKRGLLANLPGLRAGEPGFTTDSHDLYVGIDSTTANNQFVGSGRYWSVNSSTVGSGVNLVEGTDNGTSYITLKAPNSLAGIVTYTMPGTDGSNGHVLITDGSGNLSFSQPAASSFTLAADSGSNDTFNTGETLTFAGTTGEIETTVSNNQIQIGLPDNVTVGAALTVTGTLNANGDVNLGNAGSDIITVVGVTTFTTSDVYIDNSLFVGGIEITGGASVGQDITTRHLKVTGIATFDQSIDVDGDGHDIAGTIALDNVNVSGIVTATTFSGSGASLTNIPNGALDNSTVSYGGVQLSLGGSDASPAFDLSDATNLPISTGVSGLGADVATFLGTPSSANLAAAVTDETGSGALVFATSPTLVTPVLGTASATNVNVSGVTTTGTLKIGTANAVGITTVLDEDNMSSNSDTALATQQSIKAYVDTTVGAVDLTITTAEGTNGTGGGGGSVATSQTMTFSGTNNEIDVTVSGQSITYGLPSDVTVANNLTVTGNLFVNGSTTQVNTSTTTIEDQLLDLGFVDGSAPSSDLNKDIGVLFNYYSGSAKKAAVYWDDSTSRIVVSADVSESSGVLTSNTGGALEVASLYVNGCSGTTDQVIGCDGNTIVITNATIDGGAF